MFSRAAGNPYSAWLDFRAFFFNWRINFIRPQPLRHKEAEICCYSSTLSVFPGLTFCCIRSISLEVMTVARNLAITEKFQSSI
jgi:hypothetical protein